MLHFSLIHLELHQKNILLKYPTHEDVLKVNATKLASMQSKVSRGRFNADKAAKLKKCSRQFLRY